MQQKVSVETPQKHIPAVSRWLLHVCSKGGFSVLPRMLALTSLHSTPLMCIRQKFCSNPTRNRHSVQEMLGISVYHHWLQQQRKGLFYFKVSGVCILGGGLYESAGLGSSGDKIMEVVTLTDLPFGPLLGSLDKLCRREGMSWDRVQRCCSPP